MFYSIMNWKYVKAILKSYSKYFDHHYFSWLEIVLILLRNTTKILKIAIRILKITTGISKITTRILWITNRIIDNYFRSSWEFQSKKQTALSIYKKFSFTSGLSSFYFLCVLDVLGPSSATTGCSNKKILKV